jgi:hypothetical protein
VLVRSNGTEGQLYRGRRRGINRIPIIQKRVHAVLRKIDADLQKSLFGQVMSGYRPRRGKILGAQSRFYANHIP